MGTMENFNLKWNSHYTEAFGAFQSLRGKELLVDVTLSCEGENIKAHRLVLCACSSYFEKLLGDSSAIQYPIVFFKETKLEYLKLVIQFMYQGEVEVPSTKLTDFLNVAEALEIKGLKKGGSSPSEPEPFSSPQAENEKMALPASTPEENFFEPDDSSHNILESLAGKRPRLQFNRELTVQPLPPVPDDEPVASNSIVPPPKTELVENSIEQEVLNMELKLEENSDGAVDSLDDDLEMGEASWKEEGYPLEVSMMGVYPPPGSSSIPTDISAKDLMNFAYSEEELVQRFNPDSMTPSKFVAKLMTILCSTEEMASHSLCGYMTGKDFKPKLDPHKVEVITKYTILLYPYVSESLIRRSIQQKLNNVDKYMKQKRKQELKGAGSNVGTIQKIPIPPVGGPSNSGISGSKMFNTLGSTL
ncbi:unnamed protein product [Darwinula stevensoni]|uniref:BTB domain-containing protein n=1 Tax=Darwinula stevensoni TaxID=69355 RepID=A0A7R9A4P0_9CRUS|nr:unnamed protein product [Darwinula stevensoni]CAG0892926.1 unnamed protein product [Darwinula stevensoni]